jgi:hypothetical protein
MGCDIHAFVEFERWDSYWSLSGGTLNIPRDYALFTALALGPGGITDDLPYPPRGLPFNISSDGRSYFYMPASEVMKFWSEVEQRMKEGALDEDEEGGEEFQPEEYADCVGEAGRKEFLERGLLPAPELHSYSWLNLIELKEVLAYGRLSKDKLSREFSAVLAAMEVLAESYGSERVRLVFCFDGIG